MITLYHITDNGPKKCSAKTVETCHYAAGGDPHFENTELSQQYFEKKLEKQFSSMKSLRNKPATPKKPNKLSKLMKKLKTKKETRTQERYAHKSISKPATNAHKVALKFQQENNTPSNTVSLSEKYQKLSKN